MSKLRRSTSLPSIKSAPAFAPAPVSDSALLVHARFIQNEARALLAARKLKAEQQSAQKRKTDLEEKIEALKDSLRKLRNRITALEYIKQRQNLLHEQDKIIGDLESKVNKTENVESIENLIAFLNSAVSKLLVENVVLPKTEAEKRICDLHIEETLKNLSEYGQLKSNKNFDVKKLVTLRTELELLSNRAQKTASNCALLEKEMHDRVLEHNGKKCMLEIKKLHTQRKRSKKPFLQMSKLAGD